MKRFIAILTLALFVACSAQHKYNSQKISSRTKEIVEKIAADKTLKGGAVGEDGTRPEQYDSFIELQKTATKAELTELTDHPDGAVRCYAFWALSHDSTINLLPIVIKHLNDTTEVNTLFGCREMRKNVGDFFFEVVTQPIDAQTKKLTGAELEYLDSIFIYTPNKLYARELAIGRAKQTARLYEEVRRLVLNQKEQSLLRDLAKFKKQQDIPLILKNGSTRNSIDRFFTCKAICEFPDPAFRPFLKESLYDALKQQVWDPEWDALYEAIASYKDDTAYQLLKEPFTKIKEDDSRMFHLEMVFDAVKMYYTPVYNDLLWDLWENEQIITSDVFKLLCQQQPGRALQLTKKSLQNVMNFYHHAQIECTEGQERPLVLANIMLDTLIAHDRAIVVKLINDNFRDSHAPLFRTFVKKVSVLKDNSCIKALLTRFEKEDDTNTCLEITAELLTLGDENINRQIVNISEQKDNLTKGEDRAAFTKLLKEHNIKH